MVDLEQAELPHEIETDDGWAEVDTCFRTWIRFGRAAEQGAWWPGIFVGPEPRGWHDGALEFYRSPVECPHGSRGGGSARTLDLSVDGDYVVGSFQAAYGVDLTDPSCDMHWHRFLALLRSLPQDSMVSRIASWRAWTPDAAKRKTEQVQRELRSAWSLPGSDAASGAVVSAQQEIFGGVVSAFAKKVGTDG